MFPLSKLLFDPHNCTDLEIFLHYNRTLRLPKCYQKLRNRQKRCRCFRNLEVTYKPSDPLPYICQMMRILKQYRSLFAKHDNLAMMQASPDFGQTRTENVLNLVRFHTQTLNYFGSYLQNYFEKLKSELDHDGGSKIKSLHFKKVSKIFDFVTKQANKSMLQLEQASATSKEMIPTVYQELALFSHLHTLQMFKTFIFSVVI